MHAERPADAADPEDGAFSDLIRRARDGDEDAVATLHERYSPYVAERVRVRTPHVLRRRYDGDDLAQSVFLEVLRDLGRFEDRGEAAFRGWLRVKVEGKLKQKMSRMLRRDGGGRREVTAPDGVLASPVEPGPGPATASGASDDIRRLYSLVDRLAPEQQEVVRLRSQERLGFAEIAERLDLPSADAARMRFARALAALRESWDTV